MSTDKGYIRLYRDIRDHWIWDDKPFSRGQAWIDLLMMASHENKTMLFDNRPMTLKRGQFVTSLQKLADRWGWSRSKVNRFLCDLKSEQMLDKKRNARGTVLTIEKYSIYQDARNNNRNNRGTLTESSRDSREHNQGTIEGTREGIKRNSAGIPLPKRYQRMPDEELDDEVVDGIMFRDFVMLPKEEQERLRKEDGWE